MSRIRAIALIVGVVAGLMVVPVAFATSITGEVVDLSGVNDFNATVDSQARTGSGKLLGYMLFGAAAGSLAMGYPAIAAMAGGGGMLWAFSSRIVNTSMDAANSATTGDVVYVLSQGLQVQLGFLGSRLRADPIFLLALGLTIALMVLVQRRQSRVAM